MSRNSLSAYPLLRAFYQSMVAQKIDAIRCLPQWESSSPSTESPAVPGMRENHPRDAGFSTYKTYKWVDNKNAQRLDDLTDRPFESAMGAELAKKDLSGAIPTTRSRSARRTLFRVRRAENCQK
jgi:hypothetical protein